MILNILCEMTQDLVDRGVKDVGFKTRKIFLNDISILPINHKRKIERSYEIAAFIEWLIQKHSTKEDDVYILIDNKELPIWIRGRLMIQALDKYKIKYIHRRTLFRKKGVILPIKGEGK